MPARKGTSKGASKSSGSKKGATKSKAGSSGGGRAGGGTGGIQPLYGVVIREAIARGDTAEMKRLSTQARKHIKDVESALSKLDAKIK
jgi:hypothetical protein